LRRSRVTANTSADYQSAVRTQSAGENIPVVQT
jgi:hypothetical protein